jgi:hypothetical protein
MDQGRFDVGVPLIENSTDSISAGLEVHITVSCLLSVEKEGIVPKLLEHNTADICRFG